MNDKFAEVENQDKYPVFESKQLDPLNAKLNNLQIEITQKTVEISKQQDMQVNSLI